LLESGKAFACWGAGETFYLKLIFDPKSSVALPNGGQVKFSVREEMNIWHLIPPKRRYMEKLVEVCEAKKCMDVLKPEDRNFLKALLSAKWDVIRNRAVLMAVAPIVRMLLKALANVTRFEVDDFPTFEDLAKAREFGKRNGKYRDLMKNGNCAKALLEASILYLKNGYRITSIKLKKTLRSVVERLQSTQHLNSRIIILRRGLERARDLLGKVAKWAPRIVEWIMSEAYIFWLGLTYAKSQF
jgi:hypothetical protein